MSKSIREIWATVDGYGNKTIQRKGIELVLGGELFLP